MTGARDQALTMHITNAGASSYPDGWKGYQACCSYDMDTWFRVPSSYDEDSGRFTIRHTPKYGGVYYSYFAPYTYDEHMQLVARAQLSERARLEMLGETHDGHDIDMLVFGDDSPEKKKVWIIARQHPGESQAEWFVHGAIDRLVNRYVQQFAVLHSLSHQMHMRIAFFLQNAASSMCKLWRSAFGPIQVYTLQADGADCVSLMHCAGAAVFVAMRARWRHTRVAHHHTDSGMQA